MVVWLAVPTEASGIPSSSTLVIIGFGHWKVEFWWPLLWFCWSICHFAWVSFVSSCFSDSGCRVDFFEPIFWPFVGRLVGTVSNLHLDTGLLQFIQLTQATAKGSALLLPSGQRHGLLRGWRGLCWHHLNKCKGGFMWDCVHRPPMILL